MEPTGVVLMNAYLFDYGREIKVAVYEDWFNNVGHWERYQPFDLIFAETRGKARVMFCNQHDLEFTEQMKTRLIKRDVDRGAGLAKYDDPLWALVFQTTSRDGK